MITPPRGCRRRAARVFAGSKRTKTGQRVARSSFSRHPIRGFPGQRRGDRSGAGRQAATAPLGRTIRRAVEDTLRWTRSNTNLGIVLLLAPLARAALQEQGDLRDRLRQVLAETTVDDAVEVYAAIRQARPGGSGRSNAEDVAGRPTVTLQEAMALAAERDSIAREYVSSFARDLRDRSPRAGCRSSRGTDLDRRSSRHLSGLAREWCRHSHRPKAGSRRSRDGIPEGSRSARRGRNPVVWRRARPWPSWIGSCATRVTAATQEPPRI